MAKPDENDAAYIDAASKKMGVDPALLSAVLAEGVDIGEAAKAEIRDAFGLDPDLNRRNAVEAVALTLGDKIKANGGDTSIALAELRSGPDRGAWGKDTQKFVQRVGGRRTASGMTMQPPAGQRTASGAAPPAVAPVAPPAAVAEAMAPAAPMAAAAAGEPEAPAQVAGMVPPGALKAYSDGTMDPADAAEMEMAVERGEYAVPAGFQLRKSGGIGDTLKSAAGAIKEAVTGEQRRTPTTEAATDISLSPEWQQIQQAGLAGPNAGTLANVASGLADVATGGLAGSTVRAGRMAASPQEQIQIIEANFPGTKAVADEKGNLSFRSANGQTYSTQPGLGLSDVPRLAAQVAPSVATGGMAAAGRALGGAALGAGGQLALEAGQALSGGSVDPVEVGLAGAAGGALPIAGKIAQGVRGAAPAAKAAEEVLPDAATVVSQKMGARGTVPVADDEIAGIVRTAVSDGPKAEAAKLKLADLVAVNPAAREAAERLGMDLPADVFSDSPQIRAAIGNLRAKSGTEAEAAWRNSVGDAVDKADEAIASFDAAFVEGSPSVGSVSDKVLTTLKGEAKNLDDQASALYDEVDAVFKPTDKVTLNRTRDTLMKIAEEVGEELTPEERKLLGALKAGDVRYGALKRLKTQIGNAVAQKASPFANVDAANAKRLYAALAEDQIENAERSAGSEIAKKLKAANLLTAAKKKTEDRIVLGFGREANGSIGSLLQRSITQASAGDGAAFGKVLELVPEELQREAIGTALASVTRAKGGAEAGRFGFAEYAKAYQGLRANAPVYAKVAKILGPDSDRVMRDLYEISKRITEARALVASTGKANQPFMKALTAESLVEKVMGTALGRAVTTGAGAAAGGGFGAIGASMLVEAITKGSKDVVGKAGKLLSSPEFQVLAIEAATKPQVAQQTVRKVVTSPSFTAFAKAAKLPRDLSARERYILDALAAGRANRPEGEQ